MKNSVKVRSNICRPIIVIFLLFVVCIPTISAAITYPFQTGSQSSSNTIFSSSMGITVRPTISPVASDAFNKINQTKNSLTIDTPSITPAENNDALERINKIKQSFWVVTPTSNPSLSNTLDRLEKTRHSFAELKYQDEWLKNVDSGLQMLSEQPEACWTPIDSPITLRRFEYGLEEIFGVYIDGYYCDTPWIPHILLVPIGNS